jgi:uncharacterized membrane protein YphA (DoxX/SURF4 family)
MLVFIIKLVLGITFIYASWHKIEDPAGFARIIYGYGIFPGSSINLMAMILPFIELVAGFSLIMGVYPRSALLIINTLLAGFILVIGFNLLRGHQFDCGCFSISSQGHAASNIFLLVRDVFLLGSGLFAWRVLKAS